MNEITQLYKDRVEELTQRLINLLADSKIAAFYANESMRNILESVIEFAELVFKVNDRDKVPDPILARAITVKQDWISVLATVQEKSQHYKKIIQDMGIPVDD